MIAALLEIGSATKKIKRVTHLVFKQMITNISHIIDFQTSFSPALKGGKFEIVLVPFRVREKQDYFKLGNLRNGEV